MNTSKYLIHISSEIVQSKGEYGQKAFRLAELSENGYPVPPFIGIGKTIVRKLGEATTEDDIYTQMVKEITSTLNSQSFAVRSSAFTEDGIETSNAGKFLTMLDVQISDLPHAIQRVIEDAKTKGSVTEANPFSIIVEEYTLPEKAGVLFTRNPLGSYEMVIEWKKGNGEGVVGGSHSVQCIFGYQSLPQKIPFAECKELIQIAKKIEKESGFPQDIEWAVIGGKVYILQSRPITTITESQYKAFLVLDTIDLGSDYYYDNATLVESMADAPLLAQEILQSLYRKEGAITQAYSDLGITLTTEPLFTLFGNQLSINKEKELHQFFPTHTYFGKSYLVPHFKNTKGWRVTMKNMYYLSTFPYTDTKALRAVFTKHAEFIGQKNREENNVINWISVLNTVYKDIFIVNIKAEKAYKHLTTLLEHSSFSVFDVMNDSHIESGVSMRNTAILSGMEGKLIGNSINIADESIFISKKATPIILSENKELSGWWSSMPLYKKEILTKTIVLAMEYERLREEGRWLTVMCMNGIREALWKTIDALYIPDRFLGYFTTLDELKNGKVDKNTLKERFVEYQEKKKIIFPSIISSIPLPKKEKIYGVSPGVAHGEIVFAHTTSIKTKQGAILLVDTLSPHLTSYFDTISGIISRQGGLLSHIAIVAREYGVPVVVDQTSSSYDEGQIVSINGTTGTILKE